MAICYNCGDEIEFRYIDGRRTPIHLHGVWCSGSDGATSQKSDKPFQSRESYTNPNARCPVCGERVFFYQSPNGGRVFFDDLGWPWPKHPCTDNPKSQSARVETLSTSRGKLFVDKRGNALRIYRKINVSEKEEIFVIRLMHIYSPFGERGIRIHKKLMDKADIKISDITDAPSFVIRFDEDFLIFSFISSRQKKIISIKLPKI